MKNKLLGMGLAISLAISLFTGCGQSNSKPQENASTTETSMQNQTETETDEENTVSYAYEQDLNIPDDNYRNYYEIYVGSYCDSNGDGVGDLNGVTEKLDYIQDMGFTGIWLMPIMSSTTYHKYDVTNYYEVDDDYGTIDDFSNLVQECHARGIDIIIDLVMNHSSSLHPWFQEACSYLQKLGPDEQPDPEVCPYVNYYHFSQKQENGDYYAVSGTDWYYEAVFWSGMPDLNLENPEVIQNFDDIAKFWIDLGVDGFRMDAVIHFDEKDTTLNCKILNDYYTYCKSLKPDFYMVSEVWAAKATIAQYEESQTPSFFNFPMSSAEGVYEKVARGTTSSLTLMQELLADQDDFSAINDNYIAAPFLTNHDQVRVANNLNGDLTNMKMAAGLLLTSSGNPFVYYGEEIGMKSKGDKDENKRLAMEWSKTETVGMTNNPKGADSGIESSFGPVDEQEEDALSLLNYYKRALRIRNENPEIARGQMRIIDSMSDDKVAVIVKTYEDKTISLVYNSTTDEQSVSMTGTELSDMNIRGYLTANGEGVTLEDGLLTLPPKSICILK